MNVADENIICNVSKNKIKLLISEVKKKCAIKIKLSDDTEKKIRHVNGGAICWQKR